MARRLSTFTDDLLSWAVARFDRRGGAGLRRGGRGRGGGAAKKAGPKLDPTKLYLLGGFTDADYFATDIDGGEAGDVGGFGVAEVYLAHAVWPNAASILERYDPSLIVGHRLIRTVSFASFYAARGGATTIASIPSGRSEVGRLHIQIGVMEGAQISNYLNGIRKITGLPTQYIAGSGLRTMLGRGNQANRDAVGMSIATPLAFRGVPTPEQVKALTDAIRAANGDMPSKAEVEALMPGCTVTHRWSLRDTLAGQTVADGQLAPATLPDTITGATADAMTRAGSPTVRVIDTSIEGRKSYGVLGGHGAAYLQAATAGIRGAATGLTFLLALRVDSVPTGTFYVAGTYNASPVAGWSIYGDSAQGISTYRAGSGALALGTANAADVGQMKLVGFTWDGTTWRAYENGVPGATQAAGFAYAGSLPLTLGRSPHAGNPESQQFATLFGAVGCDVALSAAEVAAVHADWRATGILRLPSGKTNPHEYDITRDIAPSPDAGVPAQIVDRVGTDHLTRVGTGLQVVRHTERLWSYETTPVFHGARNWSATNYMRASVGIGASAAPYWFFIAMVIHAKAGGAFQVLLNKSNASGTLGFNLYGGGTLSSLNFSHGTGSSAFQLPTYSVLDSDLGKVLILGCQWNGSALQGFVRRDRHGGDVAASSYSAYAGAMMLGRHADTTSNAASDHVTILGVMGGSGSWLTLAEWQSAYDAFVSEDDLVAVRNKTSRLWSVKRSQNGALQPIPDAQGSGEPLTITGAPTLSQIYHRAIAA